MFASELKALKAYEGFANSICKNSLSLYMQHNYIPSPFSIYKNIYKLEPGCMLTIMSKESNKILDKIPEAPVSISGFTIKRWWDLNDSIAKGKNSFVNDELEAENTLEELLSKSIKNQLLSDVPLGALLSGGIDSSTITTLMQKQSLTPIKTFSIGFDQDDFNEAVYAKK